MRLNTKKIAKAIIEDAVLMAETFNLMNDLVNLGNSERANFGRLKIVIKVFKYCFYWLTSTKINSKKSLTIITKAGLKY